MTEHDDGKHTKEVYARFGLAMYFAQVLEHGLVNALAILDLVPSRRHLARSSEQWGVEVDAFMDRHFETTMGRMMKKLREVTSVDVDLDSLLHTALKRRNWLAHEYFRERAMGIMTSEGRELMIIELEECRELFETADKQLENAIGPLRAKAGLTEELMEQEYRRMLDELGLNG